MTDQKAVEDDPEETFQILSCAVMACGEYPTGNAVLTTERGNDVQVPVCDDHVGEVCFDIQ